MTRPRPRLPFRQQEDDSDDKQVDKMTGDRSTKGQFIRGNSGRPKGSKNKKVTVTTDVTVLNNQSKPPAQPGPGRPKGSKNKNTLLMEQLRLAGPELLDRLIGIAQEGDVPALQTVLAPLIARARDNPVTWQFGKLRTLDDMREESERILRGIESAELTPEQGIKIRQHLDAHAETIREATATSVRERFEADERLLAKARADRRCFRAASIFLTRFYSLQPEGADHPVVQLAEGIVQGRPRLIEAARTGVTKG